MKNLTMKQIAELANVSQPTVSRVINNNPKVNPEMRERVLKVIKEYEFIPNKTAQNLKRSKSLLIGVNLPEINNPYYTDLLDQIESYAKNEGYNIILHSSHYDPDMEISNIENFIARQIDGLIFIPALDSKCKKIKEFDIPTVALARSVREFTSVAISQEDAGRQVAEHFIETGHTSFGYIGFEGDLKFRGFKDELSYQGYTFDPNNFIQLESMEIDSEAFSNQIRQNLDASRYTSLFCANDTVAFECLRILEEQNIKVPEDICLVGFDNTYLSKAAKLSTINQPIDRIAKVGFEHLLDKIGGTNTLEDIRVMPELIIRNSSKK